MTHRHPNGCADWRASAGIVLLAAALAWPSVGAASPSCSISPRTPTIEVGATIRWSANVNDISSYGRRYAWEFGEGSPSSSESASPTVRYDRAGSFETKLKVRDRRREAECKTTITVKGAANVPPVADAGASVFGTVGQTVSFNGSGSSDQDGSIVSYAWTFGDGDSGSGVTPSHVYTAAATYTVTLTVTDNQGATSTDTTTAVISEEGGGNGPNISINSTGQSCGAADASGLILCEDIPVPEQPFVGNPSYSIVAINDLGMHCGDLDTRISSILPPFQVLLAQVIRKGSEPDMLGPNQVQVYYSAVSNPNDPILGDPGAFSGLTADGSTYKTNFWANPLLSGSYDPFYPAFNPFTGGPLTPLAGAPFSVTADVGLPVPNVELLYIGTDGQVGGGDTGLAAAQQNMPGILNPYDYATSLSNEPQQVHEHLGDKPFFINFPFGYVADDVNWFEGAGIPFAAYDDFGRENAYPLVRVQATVDGNPPNATASNVVATVDTVLPISGEASCKNCHADPMDDNFGGSRTSYPTLKLQNAGLPVASSDQDPLFQQDKVPANVAVEWATDINVLRLHDLAHGAKYVATPCAKAPCVPAVCDIVNGGAGDGLGDANCLTNKALVQNEPVVCQVCHYTPALDLAQFGPLSDLPGTLGNGRNQVAHQSNSRVMHNHHGSLTDDDGAPLLDNGGGPLFPSIDPPIQLANGSIENQDVRLGQMENSCYQCHPGTHVQCLRGAMFNGGMLCSDCHGDMKAVGADFTAEVSPTTPGQFLLGLGNFYDYASVQPRVPWANEPGCGSCHTGDATNNVLTNNNDGIAPDDVIVNVKDNSNNTDGIRLRQAYRIGDSKATPIVPANTRFAENSIPQDFNGFANPGFATIPNSGGAENPKLYRVSTGHEGVMCEGCHGATHAEWPNGNPNANDNVAATQLQGHTGTIIECSTCHGSGWEPSSGDTLDGPHGMHVVGRTNFADGGHEHIAENSANACRACHGSNGEGTVLARMSTDRVLDCDDGGAFCGNASTKLFPKGKMVRCDDCHSNEL
jgi:PKD repeat protein